MHTVEHILEVKNYRKCPLKKRPVNYQFDDVTAAVEKITPIPIMAQDQREPENLSLKKDLNHDSDAYSDDSLSSTMPTITTATNTIKPQTLTTEHIINVSDYCEDEGVELDQHTDYYETEEDEMIDCVDIEEDNAADNNKHQTQAAALAAAAAVAAASAAVVVPTPTYPKYGIQPWNFHMSPYTAEFYRAINNPHLAQQISPLRSDLLSPSSPSDSIGSLSPPPHYLHGRASSVSPPMHSEMIHRPIGVRQLTTPNTTLAATPRFIPYALSAFHQHPHHQQTNAGLYPLPGYHAHHSPISPAYSESSFYSMRSHTPESNCSTTLPEDLSLKQHKPSTLVNNDVKIEQSPLATALQAPVINTTQLRESKKEKNGPPRYQCPDCQKSYSTFSGLTKHQQFHCPAAEGNQVKKSFSCKDCDKTYVSLGALKMHIRTHTLPCKCNICGKAFSRPWLLQGHIRTHTGEKPFSCQHCHRAFADRSNLRAHLQTHSDIKKYSCSSCSKTFSRMSLLTKHSEGGCPGGTNNNNGNILPISDNYSVFE